MLLSVDFFILSNLSFAEFKEVTVNWRLTRQPVVGLC